MAEDFIDATELAQNIKNGKLTAAEALETVITRLEAVNDDLNVLTRDMFATARAKAVEQFGDAPFAGVPYLVKDMHAVAGEPTSFCTNATLHAPPALQNSDHVAALENAGLNFCGLSTLGEFGYLPTTESVRFGATRNPWDMSRSPGGSSGGSAAAVAAGALPMADAADGGGSIRIPASHSGLFGLKPSRDRNIGNFSESRLDLVVMNPLSRTVRDTAGMMAATERHGDNRAYDPIGMISDPVSRPLTIGVQRTGLRGHAPDPQVDRVLSDTIALLEDMGHIVAPTEWPFDPIIFMQSFGAIWVSNCTAVNTQIAAMVGTEDLTEHLESYTIGMGEVGKSLPAEIIEGAYGFMADASEKYEAWFDDLDVVLSPVLLTPAPPIGHIDGEVEASTLNDRVERHADYTMVQNATGGPAMSVPLGWSDDGLPIGMQFAAPKGSDGLLLELAYALEEAKPWIDRKPPVWAPDRVQ